MSLDQNGRRGPAAPRLTLSGPPLPPAPDSWSLSASISSRRLRRRLTSTPGNVVGLHLVQDASGLVLAGDVVDAGNKNIELAGLACAELLDGCDLLLGSDDAGDGPGALQEKRRQELRNLAVATEKEDVMRWCHCVGLAVIQYLREQ